MKVHHLNCGSMCPWTGKLAPSLLPHDVSCHCLLIESNDGLILVDTGLGVRDFAEPSRLGPMSHFLGVTGDAREAAVNQIRRLGFSPDDVRHVIPTHLDLDHAGGIVDFPKAQIHTMSQELKAAMGRATFIHRHRYRQCHWTRDTKWVAHDENFGEGWFGFNAVREIAGLPPEILLIPLFGHTAGHTGVAVRTGSKWILHAGDAYYDSREVRGTEKPLAGWKLFQKIVHEDYRLAMENQKRLRELTSSHSEVEVFCAHDPTEFRRLSEGS